MTNLKKTAIAVLALSSGAVFAGTMGPVCSAVNVTVPCESTAWDIGARALYLQANVTGTSSGTSRTIQTGTTATNHSVNLGQNPKWGWGFMVEGSYHFNTGNDLNLNWYHINNSRSGGFNGSSTLVGDYVNGISPLAANVSNTTTFNKAAVSVHPEWDAVNLEFGQHVDFGEDKSIRFHGGFEYARISSKSTTTLQGSAVVGTATPSFNTSTSNSPTYNGFGPRVGADMAYDWGNGLGLYAKGAATLLAGTSKFSTTRNDVNTGYLVTVSGSSNTVVPELEGKLGGTYSYAMAQGDLTLDVGWMWVNYFNAIRSGSGISNPAVGDLGLQGLYFGLNWMGNIA